MPNVDLRPLELTTWRKIALGSWHGGGDPSVYGVLDINATAILQIQKERATDAQSKGLDAKTTVPSLTALFSKAAAITLQRHPQLNGLIRWGRIYLRNGVTLFLQTAVDEAGKELSGVAISAAETKSVYEIQNELREKAAAIRQDRDPAFRKAKSMFAHVPAFLMRWLLNFTSFLLYTLNLNPKWLGLPRDPFGSIMITSIGSLGLDEAFAPLVSYSRVPVLVAIGALRDRPTVIDGRVVSAPIIKLCVTFDHRFIDGVHGAKMVKTLRQLLETPEGVRELCS